VLTKRSVIPHADEISANPRARSAKLRAAERTDAAARPFDLPAVPRLPTFDELRRRGG
jgi:16S rRNA (cytosine1402-N4)-methyltransferase